MITLKEARELAENITDKDTKIPKPSGLRDWISKDLLSSYERIKEGGRGNGRIGLYDDSLPVQIAVTAKLKENYTLKEIAETAENIRPILIECFNKNDDIENKLSDDKILTDLFQSMFNGKPEIDDIKEKVKIMDYKGAWLEYENKLLQVKQK